MSPNAIVDTHLHLWDPARLTYPWHAGAEALGKRFAVPEFREAASGLAIEQAVFVQCECLPEQALDEVRFVEECAKAEPRIAGIIAQAPLERGEAVQSHLEALAASPLVRGVRRLLQDEDDDRYGLRPDFQEGLRRLGQYGFTFDVCVYSHQLPGVVELVRAHDDVAFVLDHCGKPRIRDGEREPWFQLVRDLAASPNVVCKLSGLVTEASTDWTWDHVRPYVDHVVTCFGFDRILFGSDWPVVTLRTRYREWTERMIAWFAQVSETERERLFASNARRVYRLSAS